MHTGLLMHVGTIAVLETHTLVKKKITFKKVRVLGMQLLIKSTTQYNGQQHQRRKHTYPWLCLANYYIYIYTYIH